MTGAGDKKQTRLLLGLFFTQSLWNAAQGNGLRTTIGFRGDHLFPEHFYLTHWIWVFPYKLYPSPYLLFAIQALSVSLTGLATFRLAVSHSLDVRVAALLSSAVLLQPTLHGAASGINFYGYHPDTLFPALFLFALCALRSNRMVWFWALAFASMATLEQAALVFGPLGVYMAFTKRDHAGDEQVLMDSQTDNFSFDRFAIDDPALCSGRAGHADFKCGTKWSFSLPVFTQ